MFQFGVTPNFSLNFSSVSMTRTVHAIIESPINAEVSQ